MNSESNQVHGHHVHHPSNLHQQQQHPHHSVNAATTPHHASYPIAQPYYQQCCPHHSMSCIMSPVSPAPPPPPPPPAAAALARSCQMLHTAGYYPPNSPLMYSSPLMYNTARRPTGRLQRWNSLDANLSGQHLWNNDTAWSRPSLDDSYASETALFPRVDRPSLRPAFSYGSCHQSHGMYSPFCRSYEYNLWGHGTQPHLQDPTETTIASVGSPSSSHSSLNLNSINLNEAVTPEQSQQQQQPKK